MCKCWDNELVVIGIDVVLEVLSCCGDGTLAGAVMCGGGEQWVILFNSQHWDNWWYTLICDEFNFCQLLWG